MVKQNLKATFSDITKMVTTSISQTIVDQSQSLTESTDVTQDNVNSAQCKNIYIGSTTTKFSATSDVYSTESTYQSMVLTLVNTIISAQNLDADGGRGSQVESVFESIINMIETTLNANTVVTDGQTTSDMTSTSQACIGSKGGLNFVIMTKKDIFNFYANLYSQSSAVQAVSADISNYLSGTQAAKSTGILATIVKMIALIVILVILGIFVFLIVAGVGVFVYLKTTT